MILSILYRFLTTLLHPIYVFGFLPKRLKSGKEDPQRWREKLGETRLKRPRTSTQLVWFHAASVGESLSLLKLVERFIKEHPTWQILLTSGTVTSAKIIEQRFPKQVIHQYAPLDFMPAVEKFLEHWQPNLMIWVESELWPNLIQKAHSQKIPLVLLNMRLSQRSFKRWCSFKSFFLRLLGCFDLVLTQTKELADNLKTIGVTHAYFCGNLKYAADAPGFDKTVFETLEKSLENRTLWMAASTHRGEEKILLKAHKSLQRDIKIPCLILVIRHPNRTNEVAELIKAQGISYLTYSAWENAPTPITQDVFLVDQMGLMGLFYEISQLVFVGGSLVDGIGGHNILEPLRQKCVALHGPYMGNFKEVVADAQTANAALEIKGAHDLTQHLLDLMAHPEKIDKSTKSADDFLKQQTQVLGYILTQLEPYLCKEDCHESA